MFNNNYNILHKYKIPSDWDIMNKCFFRVGRYYNINVHLITNY